MKISAAKIDDVLAAPPPALAGFLLYGSNEGLSDARLQTLMAYWQRQWRDDVDIKKLAADEVTASPDVLLQAVCNQGLFARKTLLIVGQARDALSATVKLALPHLTPDAAVLILVAAELDARSSLRRLAEQQPTMVALPAYEDSPATRRVYVQQYAKAHGWQLATPALEYLSHYDVLDRRLLAQDLEKIDLYRGQSAAVTLPMVQAMLDSAEQEKLEELLLDMLRGKKVLFDLALATRAGSDISPHRIMRALQRIIQRVLALKAAMTEGVPMETALKQQGIFFKLESAYRAVASQYNADALLDRLHAILHQEIASKRQPLIAQTVTSRLCLQLNRV